MKNVELKYIQFKNDNITEIIEFINKTEVAYSTATFIDNKGITEGMQINLKAKHKNKINSIYLRNEDYLVIEQDGFRKYNKQAFEHCFKINKYDFRRKKGKEYYYIGSNNFAIPMGDIAYPSDDRTYEINNYFPSKEIAEKFAKIQLLQRKLLMFSLENGMDEIDWEDDCTEKYYIYYDYCRGKYKITACYRVRNINEVYFKDEETAERALNLFEKEIEEVHKIKW